MYQYDCFVRYLAGKWVGVVERYLWQHRAMAGRPREILWTGVPRETPAEAGADAREWFKRKGVNFYFGPVLSGAVGFALEATVGGK